MLSTAMFFLAAQSSVVSSLKQTMQRRPRTAKKKDWKQIKHVERNEQRISRTFISDLIIVLA
jgi:hypothetical protein